VAITPNTTFVAGNVLTAAQMNRLPWGVMGYASATANQTGITTQTDLTSLSVTFTANSTRIYRTTLYIRYLEQLTATGFAQLFITDGSNVEKQRAVWRIDAAYGVQGILTVIETGLSGSVTRKGRGATDAGSMTIQAGSTGPAQIFVEDIGQA